MKEIHSPRRPSQERTAFWDSTVRAKKGLSTPRLSRLSEQSKRETEYQQSTIEDRRCSDPRSRKPCVSGRFILQAPAKGIRQALIIASTGQEKWSWPLKNAVNPIDTLIAITRSTSSKLSDVRFGCTLNNPSQEMAPSMMAFERGRERVVKRQETRNSAQRCESRRNGAFLDRNLRTLHLCGKESSGCRCSPGWRKSDDQIP